MKHFITVLILLVILLFAGCTEQPSSARDSDLVPRDSEECEWSEPVKLSGTGTGDLIYIHTLNPENCDECDCAPLRCSLEITDVDPFIDYDFTINDELRDDDWLCEGDCGWMVIAFKFAFIDEPEDYAVGDTWTFSLE